MTGPFNIRYRLDRCTAANRPGSAKCRLMHRRIEHLYLIIFVGATDQWVGHGQAKREFRATDPSIRGNQRVWNADADLAIVAYRAGVERQEGIFLNVLRDGLACRGLDDAKPGG